MKKTVLGIFSLLLVNAASASLIVLEQAAVPGRLGPYIGFIETYMHKRLPTPENKQLKRRGNSEQIILGFNACDLLGVEAGYSFLSSYEDNLHADIVVFSPVFEKKHRLIASMGEGIVVKRHHTKTPEERVSFRLGTGYEYFLSDNTTFRASAHYQRGNRVKVLGFSNMGIGLTYQIPGI